MSYIFNTYFYEPLYNGLIFLMHLLPWADVGVVVILFTIFVKLVLFPLSKKAVITQLKMKQLDGELTKVKEKFKNNREEQARAVMDFYKTNNINPFSSFFQILIQLPIIIALYWVFYKGGLPSVHTEILYSFVPSPESVNMLFLGVLDVGKKSLFLAILVGVTQYFQVKYSMPIVPPRKEGGTFKDELARSMSLQMRYVLPIFVAFISYSISGAIALYWTTSNLFAIGQELYIRKTVGKEGQTNK